MQFGDEPTINKFNLAYKLALEAIVIVKEISAINDKPGTLHWDTRKDVFGVRSYSSQTP